MLEKLNPKNTSSCQTDDIDSDIKIHYVVTGKPVALRMAILSIFS
jgi:hypothetical protein